MRDAGNAVTLHHHADQPHGFFTRGNLIDAGAEAVARVAAQARELIAAHL
jgi:acetyl esterase/lipase